MLFMIRISFEILPLAIYVPDLWIAIALVAIVSGISWRRRVNAPAHLSSKRRAAELSTLLVLPLLMLAWGLYIWPPNNAPRSPHEGSALLLLHIVSYAQVLLGLALIWRHRQQLWPAIAVVCM